MKNCFNLLLLIVLLVACDQKQETPKFQQWHKVTLAFEGPQVSEYSEENPFLDFHLQVDFIHEKDTFTVPGYYAADGKSGETGSDSGNVWRVHFSPDEIGLWTYKVSFRTGDKIAVNDKDEGKPVFFDGESGAFQVVGSNKNAPDLRARGRLEYVGKHYLQFSGDQTYFIKGGADSPENLLAYEDFDGTYAYDSTRNHIKSWSAHSKDWKADDPTWMNGKGKGLIGAMNYLAEKGVNSSYFITMNIQGDGRDVWPYTSHEERLRFDCSKLDQWEVVFEHMQKLGIQLHILTQETENETLLDSGNTQIERKLYYRELIARYGHHNALVWNLGEENGEDSGAPTFQTNEQRKAMADYFEENDPYGHPVVIHTWPHHTHRSRVYKPLLGYKSFDGTSFQFSNLDLINSETAAWNTESAKAGHPWISNLDETGPASRGAMYDESPTNNQDTLRHKALWGALMAGGAGVEWYFGYKNPHNDLSAEDYRPWDQLWNYTRYAREFYEDYLPFHEMAPANELVKDSAGYGFTKPGETYAFYFPDASDVNVRLPENTYTVSWYDPRNGGALQSEEELIVSEEYTSPGIPPSDERKDWVVLIRLKE